MTQKNKRYLKMKMYMLLLLISVVFFLSAGPAFASDVGGNGNSSGQDKVMEDNMSTDEMKTIKDQLGKYSGQGINEILPDYDPEKLVQDAASGKFEFNMAGIINRVLMYLFKEIYTNIHILIKLIVLVILCAILRNLQASFLSESIGELAFYVCYIVIVSVMVVSLDMVFKLGCSMIDSMVSFMYATMPVLITLLVSGGNITSAGIFQPILITSVEVVATLMKNVFIPIVLLSTVLSIVDNISDKIQISKLAGFLKQITGWAIGLILTIFIAIISIQGSIGAVADGVASKTAKFAIGAFIPVAGKYLADAADTVIGCTLLIKNAAGIAAMVGIIAICLIPIIKIFALILLYRITCSLVEPVSDKRITGCINDVANSLTAILGITATVSFMFLITITAMISAGNISSMIR